MALLGFTRSASIEGTYTDGTTELLPCGLSEMEVEKRDHVDKRV